MEAYVSRVAAGKAFSSKLQCIEMLLLLLIIKVPTAKNVWNSAKNESLNLKITE